MCILSHYYFINRHGVTCLFGFCLFRPVKEICGFSRETVVPVTTNIESMEFRRCQNNEIGYEEHPRAGSMDDVEAIIAFFHRILGVVFTLKQFKSRWRNIVRCVHWCQYFFFSVSLSLRKFSKTFEDSHNIEGFF